MRRPTDLLQRRARPSHAAGGGNRHRPGPRLRPRESSAPPTGVPSRARRLLAPIPLAGMALVLVALVGFLAVYSSTTNRTPVLVASHDLAAGAVLHPGDLRVAELAGDRRVLDGLVPERDLGAVLGKRLAGSLPAGSPLAQAAVADQAAQTAFTLEVPTARALAGALQPGDRVTVLATFDANSGSAQTSAIARGLTVLAVGQDNGPGTDTIPVTVALPDPSLASELALANDDAKLDLLRDGGQHATAAIPTVHAPGQ
jgi:Flp pilus assembly protein CpaB